MRRTALLLTVLTVCGLSCLIGLGNIWAAPQAAATWHLDGPHSAAQFSVRHLGISTVRGTFTKVSGDINFNPSDPTKSSANVTIEAASVDTRVEMRDNDVRSQHFLDVAKYPTITFKSKSVKATAPGRLLVTGDLTLHGVTKEVTLDVNGPSAPIKNPMGPGERTGASATTKINRQDFGMTNMSPMVGDEVDIQIDVELVK